MQNEPKRKIPKEEAGEQLVTQSVSRDEMRKLIFAGDNREIMTVEAFNTVIEVRQPSLGEVLSLQNIEGTKQRVAHSLINYCFVPNTGQALFESADADSILALPFGVDLRAIQEAITLLTGVDIDEAEELLKKTQADSTSS